MTIKTLEWVGDINGYLELTDQRQLPLKCTKIKCRSIEQVYDAIKTLAVRGAPAIGVTAGYAVVLALQNVEGQTSLQQGLEKLEQACDYLASSRPTAVNLFRALQRIRQKAEDFAVNNSQADIQQLRQVVFSEAEAIRTEDEQMCKKIGQNGQKFIKNRTGILTHCNAGALATAGQGTALSVLFEAHNAGKKFRVYVDETRPLLQGARLTAWELEQAQMDVVLICDNMAGWLMRQGKIQAVITGADRIAANGDTANKIGTYSLSILAAKHNIPFYIAAPTSTFDLNIESGDEIPIEQRPAEEVVKFSKIQTAPEGIEVNNPAFDVTDAENITAIITEKGVIEKPDSLKIHGLFYPLQ